MSTLIPRSFWDIPTFRVPSIFDDEDFTSSSQSNLSISEDDQNVYIEANVPGLSSDNIEVTYDKGVLWIKGSKKEESTDESRKFYSKSTSNYSYRVSVPGDINESLDPLAEVENGVVKITFEKAEEAKPKKISVKNK